SRTSLASSINISLISGSASSASAGSDCAAVINGVNTSGISKSVNEAKKFVSTSKTSSKLLTESFMSRVSTCSVFKSLSSVDCVPSSSTTLFFSTSLVEKLLSSTSNPVLIGYWLIKLLLCKMVMAGSKLGGFCTAKSANIAGRCLVVSVTRSEEHTSELQSRENLVCRLLLEKKKQLISFNGLLLLGRGLLVTGLVLAALYVSLGRDMEPLFADSLESLERRASQLLDTSLRLW